MAQPKRKSEPFAAIQDRSGGRSARIFEDICAQIRNRLARGDLKPGDRLPAERDLALQFGASRTAVREALRSLEISGVLEFRKGAKGGAFIREGDPSVITRFISDMVGLGRISLEHLTETRVLIQQDIVILACQRATEQDFAALEESVDLTEKLSVQGKLVERRRQLLNFYGLLARSTKNEVLTILVDALNEMVYEEMERLKAQPRFNSVATQRKIIELIRARDVASATEVMRNHLSAIHLHLLTPDNQVPTKKKGAAAS